LRRFDVDGDAKISMPEFELGLKSTASTYVKAKPCKNSSNGQNKSKIVAKRRPSTAKSHLKKA